MFTVKHVSNPGIHMYCVPTENARSSKAGCVLQISSVLVRLLIFLNIRILTELAVVWSPWQLILGCAPVNRIVPFWCSMCAAQIQGILLPWPAAISPYYYPLRRKQCRFMFFLSSLFWLFFPAWLFLVQNCSKLFQGREKRTTTMIERAAVCEGCFCEQQKPETCSIAQL